MSDVIQVDDSNFEVEVLNSTVPVLVDFSATWCGPCQKQLPVLEKFAKEGLKGLQGFEDLSSEELKIKICKIDIDDAPVISAKLGIRSVPTLMLFNGGKALGFKVGLTSFADMQKFVITKTA
jgi:thioredoxin 1